MELLFLGTASALGMPQLFCDCAVCRRALRLGGRELRSRSSLLIEKKWRVDFNADALLQYQRTGRNPLEVEHLLITHSHLDHVDVNQVMLRNPKYNAVRKLKPLHIYGNAAVMTRFTSDVYQAPRIEASKIVLHNIENELFFRAGAMTVWPIQVEHSPKERSLNYVLRLGGKTIYIGYDQKRTTPEGLAILRKFRFDVAIFEATMGDDHEDAGHMTFAEMLEWKNRLEEEGVVTSRTRCFFTHLTHHVRYTHKELVRMFRRHGIAPAHDGLRVIF